MQCIALHLQLSRANSMAFKTRRRRRRRSLWLYVGIKTNRGIFFCHRLQICSGLLCQSIWELDCIWIYTVDCSFWPAFTFVPCISKLKRCIFWKFSIDTITLSKKRREFHYMKLCWVWCAVCISLKTIYSIKWQNENLVLKYWVNIQKIVGYSAKMHRPLDKLNRRHHHFGSSTCIVSTKYSIILHWTI